VPADAITDVLALVFDERSASLAALSLGSWTNYRVHLRTVFATCQT
jgi:hypothetical protein